MYESDTNSMFTTCAAALSVNRTSILSDVGGTNR